jgi:hypothetical protein
MCYYTISKGKLQVTENDVFQGEPLQIKALMKAVGWHSYEMGRFLGVYVRVKVKQGYTTKFSPTVLNWTCGQYPPRKQSVEMMDKLVAMYRYEYLQELRKLESNR